MQTMRWLGLCLAVVTWLAACGGGDDVTKARVRLVNASSGYASLDLIVDDERRFSSVTYGGSNDYVEVDPDNTDSELRRAGAATALLTFTPAVSKDRNYTVLAYGGEGALKTLLLDDNTDTPPNGKTRLRVVNAAPDAGALDVYITGTDELLTDAVPLQAAAAVGTVNGFVTISSGTRRLRVTAAGSKTDLRIDLPNFALGDEQVADLVITPGAGGVLVNALLLVERGGIARADTPQARVRVVGGVTNSGTVVASVGGTSLMSGAGAPVIGLYVPVTAGTVTPVVSVNGSAVTATATTLAAGADYTLLVYGTAAAPQLAWIGDDNRLPSDSTQAKVRLVHGVADQPAALALKVDSTPVATGVTPGTASASALQAATTTADLSVTATGVSTPLITQVDRVFTANGNYTFFVLGGGTAISGTLTKDR